MRPGKPLSHAISLVRSERGGDGEEVSLGLDGHRARLGEGEGGHQVAGRAAAAERVVRRGAVGVQLEEAAARDVERIGALVVAGPAALGLVDDRVAVVVDPVLADLVDHRADERVAIVAVAAAGAEPVRVAVLVEVALEVLAELLLFVAAVDRADVLVVAGLARPGHAAELGVALLDAVAEDAVVAARDVDLVAAAAVGAARVTGAGDAVVALLVGLALGHRVGRRDPGVAARVHHRAVQAGVVSASAVTSGGAQAREHEEAHRDRTKRSHRSGPSSRAGDAPRPLMTLCPTPSHTPCPGGREPPDAIDGGAPNR